MSKDFRASQIQTTQIISSGSTGTGAKIVVYPIEKQSSNTPNEGIIDPLKFNTSSIGVDAFIYVSGGIGERNTSNNSIAVFGGDVHISGNLTSDQLNFSNSSFRLTVLDYSTTNATSSAPQALGQVIFPANDFSGSLTLRGILSTNSATGTGSVKLFNITDNAFVEIAGPGDDTITSTGVQPTIFTSVDLFTATNFNTSSQAMYELQAYANTGSVETFVGGAELSPSGSFTGVVTNNNFFVSGSWVDDTSKLRTTASVAIDSRGNFTNQIGADVYFFVSGTFGSGSSGDSISVFGGDVRISGTLAVGTGSTFIKENSITFTSASIQNIDGNLTFFDSENLVGKTLTDLVSGSGGSGGDSFWQSIESDVTFNTGSVEVTGSAFIKNTLLVTSGILEITPIISPELTAPSGVIGLPYQGKIMSQLQQDDGGTWRTVIGFGDLNGIGIPVENVLFLGDGSSASSGWSLWSDENLFFSLAGTGSALLSPGGLTIVGSGFSFPSSFGSDVFLYVSGASNSINSTNAGASVFGGDVYISGNMVAGPTLFLSQGLTVPSSPITTKTSGVLAIPYGGQIFGRGSDNNGWVGILNWGDDLFGSGRTEVLHVQGDDMVIMAAAGEVLLLDSTSGSNFIANVGLSITPESLIRARNIGSDVYFYVSGATGGTDILSGSVSVFGGDLNVSGNLIYGHSDDAFAQRTFITSSTTGSEVVKAMSYSLSGNKLYDFDFTILAVGTGSGISKKFKRNLGVEFFNSPTILENTVFITVPDVSGSSAATDLDVTFEISSSFLAVYVSGAVSQSVQWQIKSEITKYTN